MSSTRARGHAATGSSSSSSSSGAGEEAERGLSLLGRLGLAGRTGFYMILTGITIRITMFGGRSTKQADAHGALALVSRPVIGKVAIAAVALGFLLFGVGRLVGAVTDQSQSWARRILTAVQGLFYVVLTYIPSAYLAGRYQTGSQQEQQKTTARLLGLPGGRGIVIALGVVVVLVSAQQIRGAAAQTFRDGLDLSGAPAVVRSIAGLAGVLGITSRALVFLPVGIFLMVSAAESNPAKSYGTDAELLRLSGYTWGDAVLAVVAAGLAVFVVFSAIETRYRKVVSAT